MLIGISGSICAGKKTVAQYLVDHHGFKHLHIEPQTGSKKANGVSSAAEEAAFGPGLNGANGDKNDGALGSYQHAQLSFRSSSKSLSFPTADDLLEFVTKSWRDRWVTTDIPSEAVLDIYQRRPFFVLISVDAPLNVRWQRYQRRQRQAQSGAAAVSFEDFAAASDADLYDAEGGRLPLMSRASVRLLNTSSDLAHLYATLGKVDLTDAERLRPSWDTYFMALASLAAQRSNCMKRRVGCVLVRERRVISTGYNGTPRGIRNCGDGGCPRCNEGLGSGHGLATCLCIHAEENALLEAGRERIREGTILYCDTCPCLTCSIKIAQVGISEVVYSQGYSMDTETAAVFTQAGVKLRQFVPPANGLIHLEKMELYS